MRFRKISTTEFVIRFLAFAGIVGTATVVIHGAVFAFLEAWTG